MSRACCLLGLAAALMAAGALGQEKKPAAAPRRDAAKPGQSAAAADEQAIRATAVAFVKAFNAGDSKALAALWTANADYLNERGQAFQGRAAIEKEYRTLFEQQPGLTMKLDIGSIRLLGPTIAIEDGQATIEAGGRRLSQNRYTAVHTKEEGRWLISAVRDMPGAEAAEGGLRELEFFVGDWTAKRDETTVKTNCKWAVGKRFLLRTYEVTEENGKQAESRSGLQIIGWDPASRQIRSWTFDSTGGHGQGLWSPIEGGWKIESEGVLADGAATTSTELIERVNDNIIGWQSIHRTAGGQPLADTEQVVLERVQTNRKTAQ